MNTEARTFIDALFAACPPASFITLTALPPQPRLPTPSRHIRLADDAALPDVLERLEAANRLGWSGVIGIGTRRANLGRWRRGARRDLVELPALFVDIDRAGNDGQAKRDAFPLPPSIRVASGGPGCEHWYWLLAEPARDLALADRALRGLAGWLGGDPVMTVTHSLRLPGTRNPKPGYENAPCHVIGLHAERRYTLAQFKPYLAALPVTPTRRISTPTNTIPVPKRRELIHAVEACLRADFGGFYKANGWLSALCPFGHVHDRPGQHFGFLPRAGLGYCFGRHQALNLEALCAQLHIAA